SYSLVLMDPPYAVEAISSLVDRIAASSLVQAGSTIVVEHSRRVELADGYGSFKRAVLRRHGDTCLSIYR
ncbi:MAG: RsmD family RNA methyltransferase, partial [Chloroflexi bacterium]|nr:RsmD family RNA methyltransferase [Chloroflexota bacterium]